jgi:hypothetical protein
MSTGWRLERNRLGLGQLFQCEGASDDGRQEYIEILAKSLCESSPECAQQYWTTPTPSSTRRETIREVSFSKFFDRHSSLLLVLARWMALRIDVPI